jgi:hypothetical protein
MPYGCKPVNEWGQVRQVGWIALGGQISFQGWNLFYPTHFGVQFFFFAFEVHYVKDFQRWLLGIHQKYPPNEGQPSHVHVATMDEEEGDLPPPPTPWPCS